MEEAHGAIRAGRRAVSDHFAVGVVFDVHPRRVWAITGEILAGGDGGVGEVQGVFGLTVAVTWHNGLLLRR